MHACSHSFVYMCARLCITRVKCTHVHPHGRIDTCACLCSITISTSSKCVHLHIHSCTCACVHEASPAKHTYRTQPQQHKHALAHEAPPRPCGPLAFHQLACRASPALGFLPPLGADAADSRSPAAAPPAMSTWTPHGPTLPVRRSTSRKTCSNVRWICRTTAA